MRVPSGHGDLDNLAASDEAGHPRQNGRCGPVSVGRSADPAEGSRSFYPGGKGADGVYHFLINRIPPHERYFEVFAGGGAVLRYKRPAPGGSLAVDTDAAALARLSDAAPDLTLHHGDAVAFLLDFRFEPTDFVYLDPPYLLKSRRSRKRLYAGRFETEDEHRALLFALRRIPCPAMISGYWSALYAKKLAGWRSLVYTAQTMSGRPAAEWIWMNYPEPKELHDYRYLGRDWRERDNIRRQRARLARRLLGLPRYELLALLEEVRSGLGGTSDA